MVREPFVDAELVAAGLVVSLGLALAWASWYLMAQCKQEHRREAPTSHVFCGQGEAVTVAELLEEAADQDEAARLNWTAEDEAEMRPWPRTRPYAQDQLGTEVIPQEHYSEEEWPTAILPRIEDRDEDT